MNRSQFGLIGVSVLDIDRIYAFVDELRDIDKNRVIKRGLRKGAAVFIRGGRTRLKASKDGGRVTGRLLRSFTTKVKRRKLGALAGFKMPDGATSWLHDYGTVERWTKKGYYRGRMPASYFWSETKELDSAAATEAVWDGIRQAMLKLRERYG